MTEEEAKTRWCPFARVGSGQSGLGSMNRDGMPSPHAPDVVTLGPLCIASACMAWRDLPLYDLREAMALAGAEPTPKIAAIKSLRAAIPDLSLLDAKNIVNGAAPWPSPMRGGFCGLAGAPP